MQGMPLGPLGGLSPTEAGAGPTTDSRPVQGGRVPALFYALAAAVLVADQAAKLAVVTYLQPHHPVTVIPGYLDLTYLTNTGGAFGVMPWATSALVLVACLVIIGLLVYGRRLAQAGRVVEAAAALILGGALGNLIDRVRLGHVVDFLDVHFWPVFNVADIGITLGAILLVLVMLRGQGACSCCEEE